MNKYMTQSGFYTAEIIKHIKCAGNQPVVAVLTDIETGLEEIQTYTNDLKFHSDRAPCGLDLVLITPNYKLTDKGHSEASKRTKPDRELLSHALGIAANSDELTRLRFTGAV